MRGRELNHKTKMLKLKINKEEYEKLSDAIKELYSENGDDYALSVEGVEDTGALKRAKDHEKTARQQAEKKLREMQQELADIKLKLEEKEKPTDNKGVEELYKKKLAETENTLQQRIQKLETEMVNNAISAEANRLAAKLAGDKAKILLPHIKNRLKGEVVEDKIVTKILSEDGEETADSIEDLEKSFFTNADFSSVVIGSKANGTGGSGKGSGGTTKKSLSEMTGLEEVEFANKNPEEYKRMLESEGVQIN